MRSPRGLWMSRCFSFPRRFEKLGQLIDEILKKFGYQAVRLEQFEDWVQVYHQPPIKIIAVYAERIYHIGGADGFEGTGGESPTGWSRAELTFFAPDQEEMEKISATIREEIRSFREKLKAEDRKRRRRRERARSLG